MQLLNGNKPLIRTLSVFLFTFIYLFQLGNTFAAGPTSAEYGTVLNLSGKQRMLTQKMSKEIMLIALNENKQQNLTNLTNTANLFDKTLKGLRNGSEELHLPVTSEKRILRQLDKIEKIWGNFYSTVKSIITSGNVSTDQVALVAEQNLPLLKQMNKAVGLYEKDAKKGGLKGEPGLAATINLSGKQRMLTQKMSKEFLLVAYNHDFENNKLSLLETYSLFERTLKGLKDGDDSLGLPPTNAPHIVEQLAVVNNLWVEFKPIVEFAANYKTKDISKEKISSLAKMNLPLLKEMNKAVGLYEKESSK